MVSHVGIQLHLLSTHLLADNPLYIVDKTFCSDCRKYDQHRSRRSELHYTEIKGGMCTRESPIRRQAKLTLHCKFYASTAAEQCSDTMQSFACTLLSPTVPKLVVQNSGRIQTFSDKICHWMSVKSVRRCSAYIETNSAVFRSP